MRAGVFRARVAVCYNLAMDDDIAARVYSDPLARWFVTEAYKIADTAELVEAAATHLVAAGIPVYRLAYFQLFLHPELLGKSYAWRRDQKVLVSPAPHTLKTEARYRDSPIALVFEKKRTIRVRLDAVEPQVPVLQELKADGVTDYVALPLIFSNGQIHALSIASDKAGGFSLNDLDRMFQLQFAFTRIVEVHTLRDTAEYLLDAYVGHAAGRLILSGNIQRRLGQPTIEAVIWYCDLRGFTRASDTMPRDAVIALLNDYFGEMGAAVAAAGGEILKFMGDAMLAIFPIDSPEARRETAARAAQAARAATRGVAAVNQGRMEKNERPIRFGLALHIGEVMFGNIGASARLDFTVIGPAVNHAARLEKLCSAINQPIILSAALAALLPAAEVASLGAHALKDIDEKQAVYALTTAQAAA
ncbi:MAG TPA: adenylate/guanylate cyclase domain-containing protein [Roseiarcus sp.]|nr:adenylate/guanylate cyclase domain-containing protein [Roseiarcus sp.]